MTAVVGIRQVAAHRGRLAAGVQDFLRALLDGSGQEVIRRLDGARRDDHFRSLHGQALGDRLADASAGARDYRDLTFEDAVPVDFSHDDLFPDPNLWADHIARGTTLTARGQGTYNLETLLPTRSGFRS